MKGPTKLALTLTGFGVVVAGGAFALAERRALDGSAAFAQTEEAEHDEHAEGEHAEEGVLTMTAAERAENGVTTAHAVMRVLSDEVVVPGEVMLDLYRTAEITPRIDAQVVERHARLGDAVEIGARLVTLSSVEMADAQGALIVASREWDRVRGLGRDVVSERRFVEAQVAAEQARAKVLAFGMTAEQAAALVEGGGAPAATGTFELLAPQAGTIVADDFVVGEVIEPGRVLFRITDEARVWVEAQLSPDQAAHVEVGAPVRVLIDDHSVMGRIVQTHHSLDETTRTLPVRAEVDNAGDALHRGQFVNVAVTVGDGVDVLAVPESAVILMDGETSVFKLEGDALRPTPIQAGAARAGWIEVEDGLAEGDEVAATEVFLLKSLVQKSQIGEGHAH